MAKQSKKQRKKEKLSLLNISEDGLAVKALNHLKNGQYRKSIDIYKMLLKRDDRQEWRGRLSEAYTGRSIELIRKGLPGEAVVILEQAASVCGTETHSLLYIKALLSANMHGKAIEYFLSYRRADEDRQLFQQIESLIASLILSSDIDLIKDIKSDHPLITCRCTVLNALNALSEGKDETCRDLIKKIPFSSPYRDYRLFIRGMLSFYNKDTRDASTCFDKAPEVSVLKGLSEIMSRLAKEGMETSGEFVFSRGTRSERMFIFALYGKDITFAGAIEKFRSAFKSKNRKYLLSLLADSRDKFDKNDLKRFYEGLAIDDLRIKKHINSLGGSLTDFEENRINALHYESRHQFMEANTWWNKSLMALNKDIFNDREQMNMARAFIHKRIASNMEKKGAGPVFIGDSPGPYVSHLEHSLEHDPHDRETYDRIINVYKRINDKKQINKWVDKLLGRFPGDVPALLLASEVSFAKKAYKKSTGYLDHILEIDPINKDARERKIYIHITKARKDMSAGRFHLARKEFIAASAIEREGERDGSLQVKRGLMEYLDGDAAAGKILLDEGFSLAGSGAGAAFLINIEGKRIGVLPDSYKIYSDLLKKLLKSKPKTGDVMEMIKIVIPYSGVHYPGKPEDEIIINMYLQNALKCDYKEAEFLTICMYLQTITEYILLKKYAKKALKQYPERPALIYYQLLGKCNGDFFDLTATEAQKIEDTIYLARKEGDMKTVGMIESTLREIMGNMHMPSPEDDLDEIMDELLNSGNEEEFLDMIEGMMDFFGEEQQRKKTPKKKRPGKKSPSQDMLF